MAGDNKQTDLWPADPFTRIDPKFNQVAPWSLHTFPENFMQIGVADKETKKEINKSPENNSPSPYRGQGNTCKNKSSAYHMSCFDRQWTRHCCAGSYCCPTNDDDSCPSPFHAPYTQHHPARYDRCQDHTCCLATGHHVWWHTSTTISMMNCTNEPRPRPNYISTITTSLILAIKLFYSQLWCLSLLFYCS